MAQERSTAPGGTGMLLLSLLGKRDMYGYEMIEELRRRSNHTFDLKAGTLYPLLHGLEEQGFVICYDQSGDQGRTRRYYSITIAGRDALTQKRAEWENYVDAVNGVLGGALCGG